MILFFNYAVLGVALVAVAVTIFVQRNHPKPDSSREEEDLWWWSIK